MENFIFCAVFIQSRVEIADVLLNFYFLITVIKKNIASACTFQNIIQIIDLHTADTLG